MAERVVLDLLRRSCAAGFVAVCPLTLPVTSGTTNVDFNPPMRAALAGAVATASQILLKVGDEEVTAITEATSVTERKVRRAGAGTERRDHRAARAGPERWPS